MGPAIMAAAMVVSAAGAVASGVAASNQASYQAEIANQNAKYAAEKANAGMADYAQKAMEKGMQDRAHMGGLVAGEAGSGLETNTGTAKAVQEGQRQITKISQFDLNKAATADWYSAKKQQQSDLMNKELALMEAKNAKTTGYIKAAGSLMGGMSKMNDNYGDMSQYFS